MTAEEELIELRQRNRLLEEQVKRIPELEELVQQLSEEVRRLKGQVAKDSHNSSLPPSSDRFSRQSQSRSLRQKSGKKPGGQPGHQGHTLQMHAEPTEIIRLPEVSECHHCQADLTDVTVKTTERRQVIDIPPPPPLEVTQYEGEWKVCPHCQHLTHAIFPTEVAAPVQYGPRLSAVAVYLMAQQLLPRRRTKEVLADQFGVHLSEGTLTTVLKRAADALKPVEKQIKTALRQARVIHQDETGLYVMGLRIWLHVTSTRRWTHYQVHASRGQEALDDIGILASFLGTSVHDGWATYFLYHCQHALCLVHILRQLKPLEEDLGLIWAHRWRGLLLEGKDLADRARAQGRPTLDPDRVSVWKARFLALLDQGDLLHPLIPTPKGKRGKAKQHPARNLLHHLRKHQQAVWACLEDLAVPFDNNLAEQDVRMAKVQQKISGTFRSAEGAVSFARIRGYLSTMRKQGQHLYSALEATLRGHPLLPSF
jgi:transposase